MNRYTDGHQYPRKWRLDDAGETTYAYGSRPPSPPHTPQSDDPCDCADCNGTTVIEMLLCVDCGTEAPSGDCPGEGNIVGAENGDAICDACADHRAELNDTATALVESLLSVIASASTPQEARENVYRAWSKALNNWCEDDGPEPDDLFVRSKIEDALLELERTSK